MRARRKCFVVKPAVNGEKRRLPPRFDRRYACVAAAVVVPVVLYCMGYIDYAEPARGEGYYLMAYFSGNTPEEERISFAVSDDGYNYTPPNGGRAMVEQSTGTGCARDPYILKGEDGYYYLLATDMQSGLGWTSNHAVEGSFIYNIAGTDEWVMFMDSYKYGRFFMQQTDDMLNFRRVNKNDYSVDFSPRHGSVTAISGEEYKRFTSI